MQKSVRARDRRQRSWRLWLALFAIAAQAFLPVVQAALAGSAAAGHRVAICTAQGMVWSDAGASMPPGGDAPDHRHCPFCAGFAPPGSDAPLAATLLVPTAEPGSADSGFALRVLLPDAAPPPARGPPARS